MEDPLTLLINIWLVVHRFFVQYVLNSACWNLISHYPQSMWPTTSFVFQHSTWFFYLFSGIVSTLRLWTLKKSGYNNTFYSIYSLKAKKGHPWMIDDCTNLRNDIVFRRQTSCKTHLLKSLGKTVIRDF